MNRKRHRIIKVTAALVATVVAAAAAMPSAAPGDARRHEWRSGDVLLLNGTSLRSRVVRLLQGYSTDYSHVGIVVIEDGVPFVVHADPSEGVVLKQRYDVVLAREQVSGGAVYRLSECDRLAEAALSRTAQRIARERVAFDEDFDRSDPSGLYCTELVWRVYLEAGVELRGPTTADDTYIFPADLIAGNQLECVLRF